MPRQIHEYHPIIGYRFIPQIAVRLQHEGGGYLVRTNGAGFRCDHEVTQKKPANSFRVLLFGDSFTAGDGVSNPYRYGDILESLFPSLQILNFGLSGTGMDQQYLIFREFAKHLDYDLLLISPLVENIRRNVSRYRLSLSREEGNRVYVAKPYFELSDGVLQLRNVPVPKGQFEESDLTAEDLKHVDVGGPNQKARAFVNSYLKPLKPLIQTVSSYQPVPSYDRPDSPDWLLTKEILRRWISESGNHSVVINPIPLYQHIERKASAENYGRRFQELAELTQVTVWDPLPRFWQESPESRRRCRFESDPHLTSFGHRILADALAPAIARFIETKHN